MIGSRFLRMTGLQFRGCPFYQKWPNCFDFKFRYLGFEKQKIMYIAKKSRAHIPPGLFSEKSLKIQIWQMRFRGIWECFAQLTTIFMLINFLTDICGQLSHQFSGFVKHNSQSLVFRFYVLILVSLFLTSLTWFWPDFDLF